MLRTLSPQEFVAKWHNVTPNERASAQPHFNDRCALRDLAVLDAYGWPCDLPDEEIRGRLLALNLERTTQG